MWNTKSCKNQFLSRFEKKKHVLAKQFIRSCVCMCVHIHTHRYTHTHLYRTANLTIVKNPRKHEATEIEN